MIIDRLLLKLINKGLKMLEIFLEDPGIPFRLDSGRIVRTPVKFTIYDKEREMYESLIRVSSIQNFTIEKTDKMKPEKKKNSRLSRRKPKANSDLKLSISLQ